MAPSACRISTLLWSLALLVSLLVATASSTTVTKTHITTTKITANKHHGLHAAASAPKGSNPIAQQADFDEFFRAESLLDPGLNKRTAQPDISPSTNPGMLYVVGTHLVTFTAGEVKDIDGTSFSLDTQTRTLYATGSPYYVPVGLPSSTSSRLENTTVPGASSSSGSLTTSGGVGNTTLAAVHVNGTVSTVTFSGTVGQTGGSVSAGSGSLSSSTGTFSSASQSGSSSSSSSLLATTAGGSSSSASESVTSSTGSTGSSSQESSSHNSAQSQTISTTLGAGTTNTTIGQGTVGTSGSSTNVTSSTLKSQEVSKTQSNVSSSSTPTTPRTQTSGSNQTVAASTSSNATQETIVTGTQTTGRNDSTVSPPKVSSGTASGTQVTTWNTALNGSSSTSSSPSSTAVLTSSSALTGTSKTVSASSSANSSTSITSSSLSPLSGVSGTSNGSDHVLPSLTSTTNSSQPHVSATPSLSASVGGPSSTISSTSSSITTASSHSNTTTAGVTASASSSSGSNQTSSTTFKSSSRSNSTSTTTVSKTSGSQSSAEVVTTFVSTITAINTSDASGSQTSTKVVTTVVSTISGPSESTSTTEDGDASSSTSSTGSATSTDESTSLTSTDDDSSPLVILLPPSSTSNEIIQEVTLMTGHWDEEVMEMSCKPPCTMTLPPIPLNTPATLRYPPAITSVCTKVGGQIYRYATTVSLDPITITELALLPVSVGAMTGRQPAVTSEAGFSLPHGSCSMALPSGDACEKRPVDSTNGTCGPQVGLGCPGMECCGPSGTCGTGSSECVIANGCDQDFGACWLPGESSFRPLSEVFGPATDTSACPIALLPGPSDGPEIAQLPDTTDPSTPLPMQTTTDGQGSLVTFTASTTSSGQIIPIPIPVPLPTKPPGGPPGPGPAKPPGPPRPRLCLVFCGGGVKLPGWKLDLGCRGPLCKSVGPRRGCLGICDLLKCLVGCEKKGGGTIGPADKPKPDPEDPPGPDDEPEETPNPTETGPSTSRTQSSSSSKGECETTMTATQVTAMCNIFTEVVGINMGNDTTLSAPQTTCTSTKRRITQGCEVTGTTTTMFESCTRKQTATEITKFCTESVSAGVTYTPCTKTASTVFEGCSVTATTTSVIDDVCQAQVTLAPDDPQGEFGMLPANSSNETCPYFPGVNVTVLDDQGADGQQNDTCPMPNGTRTSFDDDQGDDEPRSSCSLSNGTAPGGEAPSCPLSNATLIQGPDGAEDGNVTASCPLNSTIVYEPDGALDSDTAPLCNATFVFNMTMEQELGQGEDGLKSNQSCPLGNSTLEVDNEQGEDGPSTEDESCPVIPDGIILSPLADLGDYAATNESECPALDDRFPISWLDEQGDDWQPEINSTSSTSSRSSTSTTQSKTSSSTTDCGYPLVDNLGKCTLVMPKITASPKASVASSWSCTCDFQTPGQVVKAITKCGTTMCPNWQTTTTKTTTSINTDPLFTFDDPAPSLTFRPASCNCPKPTRAGVGTCSEVHNSYFSGAVAPGYHCACESTKIVDYATVCGQTLCPNLKEDFEAPTTCDDADCAWPTNTNWGHCSYASVSTLSFQPPVGRMPNAQWVLEAYPDMDYCACQGEINSVVAPVSNCNKRSRVCPNQAGLVTPSWTTSFGITLGCPSELPTLPEFESCDITTFTGTTTFWSNLLEQNERYTKTFCKCNKVSESGSKASSYAIPTVTRACDGGYVCHNSVGFVKGKPKAHKRILHEQATTATAAGPLLAVTTEATPGSAPTTAAEPTVLMAE